jgi:hypothetical protein
MALPREYFCLDFCFGTACGTIILQWLKAQLFPTAWSDKGRFEVMTSEKTLPRCKCSIKYATAARPLRIFRRLVT